jgi:hypothetical protein
MRDQKREILNLVANGSISAAEGAARLEAVDDGGEPAATSSTATLPSPTSPPSASGTKFVKVVSVFGSAEIVGDPSVAFAVADGPHKARQDGDTMVIEHTPFEENDTFYFRHGDRRAVNDGFDFSGKRHLTVRMNPDLPLAASVQAGNVRIVGVRGPITAEVQAGNCKVAEFVSPLNLVVQAGNVTASGRLDRGASTIRCEMGSVKLNLQKGSSVRITARTTMGKVAIEGEGRDRAIPGQGGKDVTIGGGDASLDVECTMGSVKVSAD